eukprot:gene21786-22755_t
MIDNFALAISHGLIALTVLRRASARAARLRDLVFVAFLAAFFAAGFRRPFIFVLAYVYIDVVSPQRLTYVLLNSIPISLIAVVLTVFAGLVIASRDRMFCKTKTEIIEMFMNDAKQLSIAEIRKITATRMLVLIATKELGTLVAGGVTTSAGVCIMHYIGMASMVFD